MNGSKPQILVDKCLGEAQLSTLGPEWRRALIRVMFLAAFLASSSPVGAQVVRPAAAGDLQHQCADSPQIPVSLAAPTDLGDAAVSELHLRIRNVHQPWPARTDVDTNLGGIFDPVWETPLGPPAEETEAAATSQRSSISGYMSIIRRTTTQSSISTGSSSSSATASAIVSGSSRSSSSSMPWWRGSKKKVNSSSSRPTWTF